MTTLLLILAGIGFFCALVLFLAVALMMAADRGDKQLAQVYELQRRRLP